MMEILGKTWENNLVSSFGISFITSIIAKYIHSCMIISKIYSFQHDLKTAVFLLYARVMCSFIVSCLFSYPSGCAAVFGSVSGAGKKTIVGDLAQGFPERPPGAPKHSGKQQLITYI